MTTVEVFEKELSNIYALTKQINIHFINYNRNFLNENLNHLLSNYLDWNHTYETRIAECLRALEINPGNTIDSVAKEILDNIDELNSEVLSENVKNLSFQLCLNRLISYHRANIENIQELLNQ